MPDSCSLVAFCSSSSSSSSSFFLNVRRATSSNNHSFPIPFCANSSKNSIVFFTDSLSISILSISIFFPFTASCNNFWTAFPSEDLHPSISTCQYLSSISFISKYTSLSSVCKKAILVGFLL